MFTISTTGTGEKRISVYLHIENGLVRLIEDNIGMYNMYVVSPLMYKVQYLWYKVNYVESLYTMIDENETCTSSSFCKIYKRLNMHRINYQVIFPILIK